jgi:tetratricopeptide (TPR) repeat protein
MDPGTEPASWPPVLDLERLHHLGIRAGEVAGPAVSLAWMGDLEAIERELVPARMREDNEERIRLIPRALALPEAEPFRGEYLDELAYAYAELGRFEEAIDVLCEALGDGWDGKLEEYLTAHALLGELLLRAGREQEASEAWRRAERELPGDPRLCKLAGSAYGDVGLHGEALEWETRGLELALAGGDSDMVWELSDARDDSLLMVGDPRDELQIRALNVLGLEDDLHRDPRDAQRRAAQTMVPPDRASVGVAWLPSGEYERALRTWESFAEDYEHGPYAAYCARLERLLHELRAAGAARLSLTPIAIDRYLAWCADQGCDPEDSDSRAAYARVLLGDGVTQSWPPGRNDPCWCRSARKYKKCCRRAA